MHGGVPVGVCLGNGELDEALGKAWGLLEGAHWAIVVDMDAAGNVTLANCEGEHGIIRASATGFRNAWEARASITRLSRRIHRA